MANLTALRNKIKNITDYSPELQTYNDQLDELVNDAYFTIWTTKRWTFATKEYLFKFNPDILPTRDVIAPATSVNASVTKGSRQVTFSANIDRLTPDWQGQIIQIQNYEYVISKVVTSGQVLLDKVFHGTTDVDDVTWAIKWRYYDLPHDSIELLSLGHRDVPFGNGGIGLFPPYGKLIGLPARRDEELNLRMDYKAAYAEAYVWSPSYFVPEGQTLDAVALPLEGADGFLPGSYLEVCWAFVKDNKMGALSEPKIVKFEDEQAPLSFSLRIDFKTWDNQPIVADTFQTFDKEPSQFEGYRKIIFWNQNFNRATGERLGLPIWKVFNNPGGSATRNQSLFLTSMVIPDTSVSALVNNFNQIDPGNAQYIEYDGQYNRIRPYPRVDAFDQAVTRQDATEALSKVPQDFLREGVARYYYKPPALGFQTDAPQMPNEFHQLIVYKVLQTLYEKIGQMTNADFYRRRIDDEVKQFQKRYCDHIDSDFQRGQFQMARRRFNYDYTSLRSKS
jgi:hypothetical protein